MAGPGAITATILLAARSDHDPMRLGILLAVIMTVLAICFVVFALAARIAKWLGVTANVVASRLLGVLLAAGCDHIAAILVIEVNQWRPIRQLEFDTPIGAAASYLHR